MEHPETASANDDEEERRRQEALASFELEDERWDTAMQIRDWIVLLAMMLVVVSFHLVLYFLEPGLR